MSCPKAGLIFKEPSTTNITVFIMLDAIIAVFTVITNLLCILTLIKTKSLHVPSNMLIAGLCLSDVLVGLIVQPILITYLFYVRFDKVNHRPLIAAVYITSQACAGLSFTYTIIINIDRYIAICHPFKYYAKATCRTHILVVITTSVVWLIYVCLDVFFLLQLAFEMFRIAYIAFALFVIFAANIKVIKVIKRQSAAVRNIQEIINNCTQRGNIRKQNRERSKAYTCIIITSVFLFCYIPTIVIFLYSLYIGTFCWDKDAIFVANLWSYFLVSLNSFINPVIYCIRITGIREAAKKIYCNRSSDNVRNFQRTSHFSQTSNDAEENR